MYRSLLTIFLILLSFQAFAVTVLIDPGHGGDDHGAKGSYTVGSGKKKSKVDIKEKDLTLAIAKKIKELLTPHCHAYLTRSLDNNLSLEKRAEVAETIKADLFVSIHVNSSRSHSAHGFETYYLDNHDDAAVRKVEEVENKISGGAGEEAIIRQILTDLVISRTVTSSKALASSIHGELGKVLPKKFKLTDRGLRPGLFYVLALSKRPAVLLEAGFLSNEKELAKMNSEKFQDEYARAVAEGIKKFIKTRYKSPVSLF
mgnify:CR=1 FL=1|tara:strand:+ start:1185 stop:1958 length:774 start_codon:yes stop_codon:yes gene_type:complete